MQVVTTVMSFITCQDIVTIVCKHNATTQSALGMQHW